MFTEDCWNAFRVSDTDDKRRPGSVHVEALRRISMCREIFVTLETALMTNKSVDVCKNMCECFEAEWKILKKEIENGSS